MARRSLHLRVGCLARKTTTLGRSSHKTALTSVNEIGALALFTSNMSTATVYDTTQNLSKSQFYLTIKVHFVILFVTWPVPIKSEPGPAFAPNN